MLLLSLDPKGNLMNNEQSSESEGAGVCDEEMDSTRERETRGPLGPGHDREMEGNLLVFTHQLGCTGDMKRMEGDASCTGRWGG